MAAVGELGERVVSAINHPSPMTVIGGEKPLGQWQQASRWVCCRPCGACPFSQDEVARSLDAVTNRKLYTSLAPAYATGVRASEVIGLNVTDIASQRMTLRAELVEHSNAISGSASSPGSTARSALDSSLRRHLPFNIVRLL